MATSLFEGKPHVRGDICAIRRRLHRLPAGTTVTKAWLMVKGAYADDDESALISKEVTTSNVAGTGQIEDAGATDGSATIRFDLLNADTTAVVADTRYVYAIQYKLSDGQVRELESGYETWPAEVVQATS